MLNKIMYWLGAFATFFPLFILPIPLWLSFIIIVIIMLLMVILPPISTLIELVFWICGLIELSTVRFNFITVIGILAFVFWIASTFSFYYPMLKKDKALSAVNSKNKSVTKNLKGNKKRMYSTIETLVKELDNINDGHIKCERVLLSSIKECMDNSTYSFEDVQDTEFEIEAYKLIYSFSFDLLCSGQFHVYRGVLNELNESTHLMKICKKCLDYACNIGSITEDERKEQLEILRDEIRCVG